MQDNRGCRTLRGNVRGYTAAERQSVKDNIIDTGVEVVTPGPSATEFLKRLKEKGLETT